MTCVCIMVARKEVCLCFVLFYVAYLFLCSSLVLSSLLFCLFFNLCSPRLKKNQKVKNIKKNCDFFAICD